MDRDAILRGYKQLRPKNAELGRLLIESLDQQDLGSAARTLGILNGRYIDLETEDESTILMDYALQEVRCDGRNAIERMLENNSPAEATDELRLLRALNNSRFALFKVVRTHPGFGVEIQDRADDAPIFLVDLGFSQTATIGVTLATRIISPRDGWWMTTGAVMVVTPRAAATIAKDLNDFIRENGITPTERQMTGLVLRACIAAKASRQMRYADVGAELPKGKMSYTPVESDPKPGRNELCPCGSGMKYKRCCGR